MAFSALLCFFFVFFLFLFQHLPFSHELYRQQIQMSIIRKLYLSVLRTELNVGSADELVVVKDSDGFEDEVGGDGD